MRSHGRALVPVAALLVVAGCAHVAPAVDTGPRDITASASEGIHVRYRAVGRGPRTLVLVHGNLDRLETWDAVVPPLARAFRVVTLDMPGFGETPAEGGDYSLDAAAAEIARVMDALDVREAVLVGHSLGGSVVARFAALHPERVTGLVLEDSPFVDGKPSPEMSAALLTALGDADAAAKGDAAAQARLRRSLDAVLRLVLRSPTGISPVVFERYLAGLDARHLPAVVAPRPLATLGDPLLDARRRRHFPALCLWGLDDGAAPIATGVETARMFGDASLVVFVGRGHTLHLEHPDSFVTEVTRAFAAADGKPAPGMALRDDPHAELPADDALDGAPELLRLVDEARALREAAACGLGDRAACVRVARRRVGGLGVKADAAAGRAELAGLCADKVAVACLALGEVLEHGSGGGGGNPTAAIDQYRRAAELGDGAGEVRADWLVAHVAGDAATLGRAVAGFTRGCEAHHAAACGALGRLTLVGAGGATRDPRKALDLVDGACRDGDTPSCTLSAWLLDGRDGIPADPARALTLRHQACAALDGEACAALADTARQGGANRSYRRAAAYWERACALGVGESCFWLASLVDKGGRAVDKDPARALALLDQACTLGWDEACRFAETRRQHAGLDEHEVARLQAICDGDYTALACERLGDHFRDGDGVPQDLARARALYEKGCAASTHDGCEALGDLYRDGTGVPRDAAKAASLYERACEAGRGLGCVRRGALAWTGLVGGVDHAAAERWFARALDSHDSRALLELGHRFLDGDGAPRDRARAEKALAAACDPMHVEACE